MKNKISAVKEIAGKNRAFTVFVCIQIIVLLVLLVLCFTKKRSYDISTDTLSTIDIREGILVTYEEDGLYIENPTDKVIVMTFYSDKQEIASGTYELTVRYAAQTHYDDNDLANVGGFVALGDKSTATMDELILDNMSTVASGRVTIEKGDFRIAICYNGEGDMQITGISLSELLIGRWLCLLEYSALFLLIDFLYLLLFGKETVCIVRAFFKNKKSFLGILGISVVSCLPCFADFMLYGHDIVFHMQRIVSVAQELSNHQFPVRMYTEMLNGYGYAVPLYYCDIFLYIPALLYNIPIPLYRCYQIYVILISFGTTAVSYFVFHKMTKDRPIALMGAALYTLSAYRLMNVYIRAAAGEYTAMLFLPLVLYGVWRIYTSKKPVWRDYFPLAAGMAGILQCHVLTVEMTVLFLVLICLLEWRKTFQPVRIAAFVKAAVLTVAASAWFVVPFISSMYSNSVAVNFRNNKIQSTGLYPVQLLNIFMAGSGIDVGAGMKDEMPLTIGLPLIVGLAAACYCLVKRGGGSQKSVTMCRTLKYSVVFSIIAMLMTMYFFPWDNVEKVFGKTVSSFLGQVQFSWRYLAPASLFLVMAAVAALYILKRENIEIYIKCMEGLLIALVLATGVFFWNCSRESDSISMEENIELVNSMSIATGEYLPKDTDRDRLYTAQPETTAENVVFVSYKKISGKAYLTCANGGDTSAEVLFPILNYANYKVYDLESGQEYEIQNGDNNRIAVTIDSGYAGVLCVEYVSPVSWRIAEIVSAVTVLGVCIFWIINFSQIACKFVKNMSK